MQTPWLLLLSFILQGGDQQVPLLGRTMMVRGKEQLQFRHNIYQHPRTGIVTEAVDWNSFEKRKEAYLRFYKQLSFPAIKSESSEERESIQKTVVHNLIQQQIPPGTPVVEAEEFLLLNGFRSIRRCAGMPANTIDLYGRETVKNGLFDWNNLFVINVSIRFDDARKVTEIIVRRAVYTYAHKGV